MKRKIMSVLLSLLMLLTCVPLSAVSVSAESITGDGLLYEIVDGEVTITGYTEDLPEHVVIPATIEGYPVVAIGNGAFGGDGENGNHIVSVVIPEGVQSIGDSAFSWADKLVSVEIPDTVTYIGRGAFWFSGSRGLGLEELIIPNGVTIIRSATFGHANIASFTIPDSVTTIEEEAFVDCALSSVVIPDSVTTIGEFAFQYCTNLTSVVLPDGIESIARYAFSDCYALTSIVIPDSIKVIESGAFCGAAFTEVTIPNGVTTIGDGAFGGCENLNAVALPKSIESVERSAFAGCSSLSDVYYGKGEKDRANIIVGGNNDPLLNAAWHYNCINPKDHYSDDVPHSVMDTENGNGLAFKFELNASVSVKGKNKLDFAGATINYLGQTCKLVGMGVVITNQEGITPELGNTNGKTVIDIPTVYLTDWELGSCAFAARIINIPNYALERVIYARPYYVVEVDGEHIVVYGDIDFASCAEYM